MRRNLLGTLVAFAALTSAARPVHAQEFDPRTYAVAPIGLNFIGVGYGFASGGVFLDPALAAENIVGEVHAGAARYVRTLGLFGLPSKVKLVLPWSSGHWRGTVGNEFLTRDATGLGDARVIVETLFHGAEVMTPAEMRGYRPRKVFGARLQVVAPTGDYDSTKGINLGGNRWSFVPEVGVDIPFGNGKWSLEAAIGAWLFTDNDDFFNGLHLSQDPLWFTTLHAIRQIRPGFWWAIAAGGAYGGRTTVEGVPRATIQRRWRLFAVVAYPITRHQGFNVSVGTGFNRGAGTDFDAITVGYQFSWGGG